MAKSPLKPLVVLLLAAFIVFLLGNYTPLGRLWIIPGFAVDSLSYLFGKFNSFHKFADQIRQWKNLSAQNERLMKENNNLLAGLAKLNILEEENDFLKKALDIRQQMGKEIVYAQVFNFNFGPDGYNLLINKGAVDGIVKDDVVVTEEKTLVGMVDEVSENFSRIIFVSDPKFKITAKVMGGITIGIVKGALTEGMYFDLIAKEDEIKEGDILISTGNDMFPAALIVGKVAHVEINESQTFKKVRIDPAPAIEYLNRVIVIKRNP